MNIWYELTPVDTLFFRGAEAMEAGLLGTGALFPPPVSVVLGALRSAVVRQSGSSFTDYNTGNCPSKLIEMIGESGAEAPFSVSALLLQKNGVLYGPCPAHWFAPGIGNSTPSLSCATAAPIQAESNSTVAAALDLHSSSGSDMLPFAKGDRDLTSLGANWLRLALLGTGPTMLQPGDLLPPPSFYEREVRTGIGLDGTRKVVEGRLYSAEHIRLHHDVSIVIGIDRDIGLAETGTLFFGGERRVCGYAKVSAPELPSQPAERYMALAPVQVTATMLADVFCAPRPVTLAGWDLDAGFHKPTSSWLPAGSVFSAEVATCCVPLPS